MNCTSFVYINYNVYVCSDIKILLLTLVQLVIKIITYIYKVNTVYSTCLNRALRFSGNSALPA